ncbi:zf-HC2 domain-containing protein [Streptomyces sp. NPDC001904]|uniref:anti-sigma factor family protein n=1 Tax=Streptomyces sp. NPDC001904 TaxID=3154531 RepID=UPI0033254F2B
MRSLERHRDAGAYALGVLDPADRFRFEDHLAGCAACTAYIGELTPTTGLLAIYARATPPCVDWCARAAPTLVERAVDRLGALHRAGRRRVWAAVGVLALLAAAGAGAVLRHPAGGGNGLALHGRDSASGVTARLTADGRGWGSRVDLEVRDPGGPRVCRLVAVGRDGTEQTVASWSVHGGAGPDRVTVTGGAAERPDAIARFEVRSAGGGRLLSLPVPVPSP